MNRRQFLGFVAIAPLLHPFASRARDAGEPFSFLVIGDWGSGSPLQRKVGQSMAAVAKDTGAIFVLSTGDNIYPSGVSSATDKQWKQKFVDVYSGVSLPWWAILGNHDHRGNVDAQVDYSNVNAAWHMPGRTWSQEFEITSVTKCIVAALDTTPIMQQKDGWREQLQWLDGVLTSTSAAVRVVAGHHPLRSYGLYGDQQHLVKHLKPILDKHAVQLYCCGHDHDLQVIRNPEDHFTCLVSGGGGGSRPTSSGAFSKASLTGGGFARVSVHGEQITTYLYDAAGTERGRVAL